MEQIIFKISLIISLSGILLLLLLTNISEPELTKIEKINNNSLNKKIKIQGEILKIENKTSFKILSVSDDTGKIDVLCNPIETIKTNQEIIVIGRVKEYHQLQIQADKITTT